MMFYEFCSVRKWVLIIKHLCIIIKMKNHLFSFIVLLSIYVGISKLDLLSYLYSHLIIVIKFIIAIHFTDILNFHFLLSNSHSLYLFTHLVLLNYYFHWLIFNFEFPSLKFLSKSFLAIKCWLFVLIITFLSNLINLIFKLNNHFFVIKEYQFTNSSPEQHFTKYS